MAHRTCALVTGHSIISVTQMAKELSSDLSLQISTATTVSELWRQIESGRPQVVLLDTQVAGAATPQLVAELTQKAKVATLLRSERDTSADLLLDALEAGALAVLDKPASIMQRAELTPSVLRSIRAAGAANLGSFSTDDFSPVKSTSGTSMLAIGAGMGGLRALTGILSQLPIDAPGMIVISSLTSLVVGTWVDRLNRRCTVAVKLAEDGDRIKPGQALVAPGGSHVLLRRSGQGLVLAVKAGPSVFHQKPSTEILFNSIAEIAGRDAVGVLLGGAGVDGVAGLMHLRNAGGRTIAESAQSSVIAEVPSRAKKCGAVDAMLPANKIAAKMMEFASWSSQRAA